MRDRHTARMLAFVYYCLDMPVAQIASLVGITVDTINKWKQDDNWDHWQPAIQSHAAAKGVPLWATRLLKGQASLTKQVAGLNAALAARATPP